MTQNNIPSPLDSGLLNWSFGGLISFGRCGRSSWAAQQLGFIGKMYLLDHYR